tara:strand:+ start:22717 stop:23559 length:843 start_codon:yes stop_codon:yes gene_type:complete
MKKLLSTTAMLTSIAFASSAYAAEVYEWTVDGVTTTGTATEYEAAVAGATTEVIALVAITDAEAAIASDSLLDSILADATALSASVSNISQNLNNIDGSIDVTTDRDFTNMDTIIGSLGGTDGFGSYSQAGANVFGRDIPDTLLAVLDPLTLSLGDLATTAIGTLQSGNMTGSFDSDGLVSTVTTSSTAATTSANAAAEQYAGIADTIAMQNISVNSGAIDGSVALILADVNTIAGGIATTAIGALQSGAMEATIAGNMGGVTEATSDIVTALVGSTIIP